MFDAVMFLYWLGLAFLALAWILAQFRKPSLFRTFLRSPQPLIARDVLLNSGDPATLCDVMNQAAANERIRAASILGF